MKWSYPALYVGIILLALTPVGLRVLSWPEGESQEAGPGDIREGETLFTHEWQPKDPLCAGGDGLGPVYNATSCKACHDQGGLGGSGGLEHNVTTFVIESRVFGEKQRDGVIHAHAVAEPFRETLQRLSPQLPAISQPSLRQLGVNRRHQEGNPFGAMGGRVIVQEEDPGALPPVDGIHLAQRNTPALFGAGLINSIPDRIILANAKWQRMRYGLAPGDTERLPVGRPMRQPDGRIGKFGWKAQAANLSDFVQAACANELGLSNPGHEQPTPLGKPGYQAVGLDLTQKQCDQMTAFIASLPRPEERMPADHQERAGAERGKKLFNQVGCAGCHTPDLGSVSGVYSDFLLHRMGQDLESGGSSYGGAPPPVQSTGDGPLAEEWRTPPLWGVADSAPYMHDGRAATLEDAIRMHGGQGTRAAKRFERLAPRQRAQLIGFLKTLRAPAPRPR